jgi:hypothetical protein
MKIEIYKNQPGEELFLKIILDNGNWAIHSGIETTNDLSGFKLTLNCKEREFAQWILNHSSVEDKVIND